MASSSNTPKTPNSSCSARKMLLTKSHSLVKKDVNFSTPRRNPATPKQTMRTPVPITPECFSKVTMETPREDSKGRNSKEKFDEISNLTVAVRIRPLNSKELDTVGVSDVVRVRHQDLILRSNIIGNSSMSVDHIFQYDHIFWSCNEENPIYSTQEDVYLTIGKPLLNSAFRGYNACLFAYGQTGSGKSFSMMGKSTSETADIDSEQFSGIIPRFCRDLFQRVSGLKSDATATIEVSYFEIYNEKIHDLLSTQTTNKTALKVREHPVWGPYVVDLSSHPVKGYKELRNWLVIGNKNRATAATSMNEQSSRSHSIFSIEMCLSEGSKESDCSRRSKVSLVDLAGSERLGNSHSSEEKIKQGVYINKSLLTLGKVISSLADQKKSFVPYRDSVLTWLLKESLGGNSLTSMLATISPASSQIDETLATLRYACQARTIVNRARINENPHDRLIRELRSEVERLRALRQDYERNSISCCSSLSQSSDSSNIEELDDLKNKLTQTQNKLEEAEKNWHLKFLETRKLQLREAAETERLREELQSRDRILKTAEKEVSVSPYRTNFLKELENVLTSENESDDLSEEMCLVNNVKNWCLRNGLESVLIKDSIIIRDNVEKKQVKVPLSELKELENIGDYIINLNWTPLSGIVKKLFKNDVVIIMNEIYHKLSLLQPQNNEDNLSLLYAKVNRSLQCFESALMNKVSQKTVTFNISTDVDVE